MNANQLPRAVTAVNNVSSPARLEGYVEVICRRIGRAVQAPFGFGFLFSGRVSGGRRTEQHRPDQPADNK